MFDFHMHSTVSQDGRSAPEDMVRAAAERGMKEICFTDHIDYQALPLASGWVYDTAQYSRAYDHLSTPGLKIRKGMEFGMAEDNAPLLAAELGKRPYDFVIGSVHFVDGWDVYLPPYWQTVTVEQAYRDYLEAVYRCVQAHEDFDVLGHLTYICKCSGNPTKAPLRYEEHREILDEILKTLAEKGKGMELNTSGIIKCGFMLPTIDFFRRFKELGGTIVTVGSDAHEAARVGLYNHEACALLREIFGYVCTFEDRRPIFHT